MKLDIKDDVDKSKRKKIQPNISYELEYEYTLKLW